LGNAHSDSVTVFGTPEEDAHFWRPQTTDFTCAVQAQACILHEFTGQELGECTAAVESTMHGWLSTDGTSPEDVGRLLELHGVECHSAKDATVGDLMAELSLGHKVIVGVHAEDLWDPNNPMRIFDEHSANHAIWVTGVDASDPEHPRVIINDSGKPDGAGNAYDLNQFIDAWQESGYFYVATDHAPPHLAQRAEGFDEQHGMFTDMVHFFQDHIPDFTIAGAAWAVGHVAGDFTGSEAIGVVAHTAAHIALDSLLRKSEPVPALPPPPMEIMTQAERDRLFREI
jgi:hypothetical protein